MDEILVEFLMDTINSTLDIQPSSLRHRNDGTIGTVVLQTVLLTADQEATLEIWGRRTVLGR